MTDLLAELGRDRAVLAQRQAEADRVIAASGAGHLVHEMHRTDGEPTPLPWRIDPVPLVLDADVFAELAEIVAGRLLAYEAVLGDLYGSRQLLRDGVVPAELLSSAERYRVGAVGAQAPRRWLTTFAVDFVQLADGSWCVVRDLTDAPTGIGFALLDRSAMLRVADEIIGPQGVGTVAPLGAVANILRRALFDNAGVVSPRVVIHTAGVDHPGYVEQSWLARTLGLTLVERPDLVVRQDRVFMRTLGGLAPVDVIHRFVSDVDVDPVAVGVTGGARGDGVPGLLGAAAEGAVALANAYGSALIEEPMLVEHWPAAASALGAALPGRRWSGEADLFTYPAFQRGELTEVPVVVRLHAIATSAGVEVVPGGNGRVLGADDTPDRPTASRAKDVWVVGFASGPTRQVHHQLPQVDFTQLVPTRAADALYWAGRAAERAEAIAKTTRAVAARRRADPGLVNFQGGEWSRRMVETLRQVRGLVFEPTADAPDAAGHTHAAPSPVAELEAELKASSRALVSELRSFVAEAATVGEFLPANTSRTLNALMRHGEELGVRTAPIDAIDDVLAGLAAFRGMWMEATVRGPAWRFGDIGFRLQRSLTVLELAGGCVLDEPDADPDGEPAVLTSAASATIEVLLTAAELLVAYRRQYRSDIDPHVALELLVRDADNPASYRASLERLIEHSADVEWAEGTTTAERLLGELLVADLGDRAFYRAHHAALDEFSEQLVARWLATPAKPAIVRARPRLAAPSSAS